MTYNAFWFPEAILDTPRLFTAIAEWLAIFVYFAYADEKYRNLQYREGPFIGYRYYDTAGVAVQFPFGYGLSYTTFSYGGLVLTERGVSFTVTNTGMRVGAEIAQMYVGKTESGLVRPKKELKGFTKTNQWVREGGLFVIVSNLITVLNKYKNLLLWRYFSVNTIYTEEVLCFFLQNT